MSPFYRTIKNVNAFAHACMLRNLKIIKIFLEYVYQNWDGKVININDMLNIENGSSLSTCLHFTAKSTKSKSIEMF